MQDLSKNKCVVCGRVFPEGQGVVLRSGEIILSFHSNKCASKFLKILLEKLPSDEAKPYLTRIVNELDEVLKAKARAKAKKI
ncbi:MAG: hypothetical protein QW224_03765 [Desulfurococcaceae archaeon]